ncbi:putative rhamnosyl transferase [Thalassococcus lentus]|uniref:Rhamnosyl transferase n=2 Tax=Thalassococcus lentus TaxID=1210524 RepID=A0ABT4XMJ1_9RHOB|nr:putative rhamnosyl transferase [Thalassococcus lentus]MDA7423162.1 putative rhamnosyl transferase [Thalassococcus lentus]
MQVIGLCRFSYPAEGGFQVEHQSIEDRRAYLYDPVRMDERFATFQAITLPALKAQTDQEFTFAILIDEALPDPLAARLFDMIADMPQAKVIAMPPGPHRKTCQSVLNGCRNDVKEPCLQFRLDDDDAVAVDFVERLKRDSETVAGLHDQHRSFAIDYNRGFIVQPSSRGIQAKPCVLPFYPMGLGMAVRGGNQQSIMNFAHGKLPQFMPTVTFTDTPMYLRGHNDFNDSRQKAHVAAQELPDADPETLAILKDRFAVTPAGIKAAFGV